MTELASPLRLPAGVTLPNRIAKSAMSEVLGDPATGAPTPQLERLYERWGAGGAGLLITGHVIVDPDGRGEPGNVVVTDRSHLAALTRWAAAAQRHGARLWMQLNHAGRQAPRRLTRQPVAPSPIAVRGFAGAFARPRALTDAEIRALIERFATAAAVAKEAGFAGVQLHAAHGYLISQFLSARTNQRDDAWGGDLVGRARLLRTIARRVRAAVPAPFVLGVRISPEEFGYARGVDLDESLALAGWLADDGVDFLHLSLWEAARNTAKRPEEHAVPLFRRALPQEVRIVVAGNLWTAADAMAQLERGADMVAIGRAAILNPDWPRRIADPAYAPERGPLTPAELQALAISARFVEYLRRFRGMVRDG